MVITAKRREAITLAIAGAALAAAIALGSGGLSQGWALAKAVGRSEVRLETLEKSSDDVSSRGVIIGRIEQRLDGIDQRLNERLDSIDNRLEKHEANHQQESMRRNRR